MLLELLEISRSHVNIVIRAQVRNRFCQVNSMGNFLPHLHQAKQLFTLKKMVCILKFNSVYSG